MWNWHIGNKYNVWPNIITVYGGDSGNRTHNAIKHFFLREACLPVSSYPHLVLLTGLEPARHKDISS